MIEVGIGKCTGPVKRKGLSSKEVVELFFYFLSWTGGLTVIYECNNGCLGGMIALLWDVT